ncbi:50S ribosomal protein L19 [bacterium]|nr:50S ribosomal protein L19 [bacterium]
MAQKELKKEVKKASKPEAVEKVSEEQVVKKPVEDVTDSIDSTETNETKTPAKEEKVTDRNDTFRVGDTVKVFYKIIEGGKERVQPYEGTVISKRGEGISKTFIVRRMGIGNIGVERIFPTYSPKITELTVLRKGKARRAKLFYLRKALSKKDARIKERV